MDGWYETEVRVRYAETDQMGIVHHSNYLVWFEAGRSDLCRQKGFSYKEMEEQGDSLLVVAETYCRYKSPAYYEDVLLIRTKVGEIRSRSIRFIYEVSGRLTARRSRRARRCTWSPTAGKRSSRFQMSTSAV